MSPALFEQEYLIHSYEVDCKKRALITSLMNFLNDVAMRQSEQLGVGIDYLKGKKAAWVLYKWDIRIHNYPMFNEKITVKTAPHSFRKFYAYRKFEMLNKNKEKLVSANSVWLLVDTQKKRPIKITKDMYKAYQISKDFDEPLEIGEIGQLTSFDMQKNFNVRYSDIDTNSHVNNVKYAAWSLETVPLDIIQNYTMTNLKIAYLKETTYGKTIKALTQVLSKGEKVICLHKIVDEDNQELCLLESVWGK
ncbi:MAG TPA: acyl-ACP thioesterase [Thermoanaerobacterales bacterium]|jgi:medium-chain acyl-[acyl-carrier-protein] hydrolase|nr:acyl-ACP thioesterase [Thermoanaerobacterales bacterium]